MSRNSGDERYRVVINHEEQYVIWPVDRALEPKMRDTGQVGTQRECELYIEEVWTDRPRSSGD